MPDSAVTPAADSPSTLTKHTAVSLGLLAVIVGAVIAAAGLFHSWIAGRFDKVGANVEKVDEQVGQVMKGVQDNGARLRVLESAAAKDEKERESMWRRLNGHTGAEGHPVMRSRLEDLDRRLDRLEKK